MSAVVSPCGLYRFRLDRSVGMEGAVYAFFGINPSTADAHQDDPTVRKWIGFVKTWGGSRFIVGNVSPIRATDVRELNFRNAPELIAAENQQHIDQIISEADFLVPCWGRRQKVPKLMHPEIDHLLAHLLRSGKPVFTFGLTAGGDPMHPLMLAYSTQLVPIK
jgi:hypothetical protein